MAPLCGGMGVGEKTTGLQWQANLAYLDSWGAGNAEDIDLVGSIGGQDS